MSFVHREIARIRSAILADNNYRVELYAAQQALEWALEPSGIRSPYEMIMGTQEDSRGCQLSCHPQPSECVSGDRA